MDEIGFGLAPLKEEGGSYSTGIVGPVVYGASNSRWIELCFNEEDFKETGVGQEIIEVMAAEISSKFNSLDELQKYRAIVALINRLIPESGY